MKYDKGNRVFITPNKKFKNQNKLEGICGNFDGKNGNDKILRNNETLGKNELITTSNKDFVDDWRNNEDCDGIAEETSFMEVCDLYSDRKSWAYKGELNGSFNLKLTSVDQEIHSG